MRRQKKKLMVGNLCHYLGGRLGIGNVRALLYLSFRGYSVENLRALLATEINPD